jgi:glutamate/aspartate transport system substrate-binding protein
MKILSTLMLCLLLTGTAIAQQANLSGTLKKAKDKNVITIGFRETSVPFSFLDDKQLPVGYSIDLCMKIIENVKRSINAPTLQVQYTPVNPQNRLPLVMNGTVDMECGVTTNNEERQRQVAFTYNTYVTGMSLMVQKGSPTRSLGDLKGKSIAVNAGSTTERLLRRLNEEQRLALNLLMAKDNAEGFLLLETGRADALAQDEIQLFAQRSRAKNPADFDIIGGLLSFEPYSIVVRKDDKDFEKVANDALAAVYKSGEIQIIYDKWFKTSTLNVPMNAALKQAIASPNNNPAK